MLALQLRGCHNIDFVTPEHLLPQVLEALALAAEHGLELPLVYNTSAYDSLESLRLLDGVVDIYMPDFKYWDPDLAFSYLKVRDYPEVALRVVREMQRQVGDLVVDEQGLALREVLVRHLVMPGETAGTAEIMRWLAEQVSPDIYVNVMDQYHPDAKVSAEKYQEIDRRISVEEFASALEATRAAGVHRLDTRTPMFLGV